LRISKTPKPKSKRATDWDIAKSPASKGISRGQFRDNRRHFRMAPNGQGQFGLKLRDENLGAGKNLATPGHFNGQSRCLAGLFAPPVPCRAADAFRQRPLRWIARPDPMCPAPALGSQAGALVAFGFAPYFIQGFSIP
jgi:hypothetical protein